VVLKQVGDISSMHIRHLVFLFAILAFLCNSTTLAGQNIFKRYINYLMNDTSDVSRPQLLVYPTVAFAPETSWEFGFNTLYVYFAKRDTTNRLSEINAFTFFTLNKQYGLWFDHALYSDKDKWFFLGKIRYQSFPLFYYGIGADTPNEFTATVETNQMIIKERVLRKIVDNVFVGLEVDYQRLSNTEFVLADPLDEGFRRPLGADGSSNFGIGLGLVYDNRHNVLNVRDGLFSELAFLRYNQVWGSDFDFTTIYSDTRIYKPMGKNNVLAAQLLGQFNFGNIPFNQLALVGGENIMRGYYFGRYRDKNQIATQVEYRFLPLELGFTKRIGFATFAGVATVFDDFDGFSSSNIVASAGVGLRFLLFPKKDIWTRLDYAVTSEGSGVYIFIGEAF